jgi:hypothetical protein
MSNLLDDAEDPLQMVGGGAAGSCTATSGILSQYEVDKLISGKKPTLDTASQTYWLDISMSFHVCRVVGPSHYL